MSSQLEFRYIGRRHLLLPWLDGHRSERRHEKWQRIAGSEAVHIVRLVLRGKHTDVDQAGVRTFWRSLPHGSSYALPSERHIIDAIIRETEQRHLMLLREELRTDAPAPDKPEPTPPPSPAPGPSAKPVLLAITRVDDHFAPSAESLDITYRIQGLASRAVTLTISGEHYGGSTLLQRELTAAEKADGEGKTLHWDGVPGAGTLKGRFAHPLLGPFHVELAAAGGPKSTGAFKILYHSIELGWGEHTPDGQVPPTSQKINFAQVRLHELHYDPGPVTGAMNPTFQGALRRFQRANYVPSSTNLLSETGNLDDATFLAIQLAQPRDVWESGKDPLTQNAKFYVHDNFFNDRGDDFVLSNTPQFNSQDRKTHAEDHMERAFLPLQAAVKLLSKANKAANAPQAVGPAPIAFEADDGPEDASVIPAATNGTARTFVANARQFGAGHTAAGARIDASGDNAPANRGGFRAATPADNIKAWFPNDAGSRLAPFQVQGYGVETRAGKTFHRAIVPAWDDAAKFPGRRGRAGAYLRLSTKGGDDVKVRVALTFEGLPNAGTLKTDHAAVANNLHKETGRWTVWRRTKFNAYCQQTTPTRVSGSPSFGLIADRWAQAFLEVEGHGAPAAVLNYASEVPEAVYRSTILAMPAARRPPGVTAAGGLVYRATCIYGGPAITQSPGEPAAAFISRARSAMQSWIEHPLNAVLGVIHDHVRKTAPEGLILLDFRVHDPITGQDWNPAAAGGAGAFVPSANPLVQNQTTGVAGYVRLDGAVTMCVDNPFNVNCYVMHEAGHGRFLYHHFTDGGTTSDNPTHHDSGQKRCIMSYGITPDTANGWDYPFCGKCILRLRGWDVIPL